MCWQSTLGFFSSSSFFFVDDLLNWKSKRQTREWKIIIVLFQNSLLSCHKHSLVYESICKKKKKKILTKLVQIKERIIDEKNSVQIVESVEKRKEFVRIFLFFFFFFLLSFFQSKKRTEQKSIFLQANLSRFSFLCHTCQIWRKFMSNYDSFSWTYEMKKKKKRS